MKKIVFIVEDDLMIQAMLQHHVEISLGSYLVKTFSNPEEAISRLHEKPFAIVLDHFYLDSTGNGLNYLSIIRKKCPGIPVIYHTSSIDEDIKAHATKAGARYIHKDSASLIRLRTALDEIHQDTVKRGVFKNALNYLMK